MKNLHFPSNTFNPSSLKTKYLFLILIILLCFLIFNIFSNYNDKKFTQHWKIKSVNTTTEQLDFFTINQTFLLNETQPFWHKKVKSVIINLSSSNTLDSIELSTNKKSQCIINIKASPDWYTDYEQEKINKFLILNLISECYIGNNINKPPKWNFLTSLQKEKAKQLFVNQTKYFEKICNNKKDCTINTSQDIYEQMIKDSISAYWWLSSQNDTTLINFLYEKRFFDFLKEPSTYNHPTHFVFKEMLDFYNKKTLNEDKFTLAAEEALFAYLQEMEFHYDNVKQVNYE